MRELIRGDIAEFPRSDDDKIKAGPSDWANRLSLWARQQEHLEEWSLERVRAVESDLRAVGELHRKLQARLEKAGQRALGGLLSRL